MEVYWKHSDGNYYGSFKQQADLTHDLVTITQFQPDLAHPATANQ